MTKWTADTTRDVLRQNGVEITAEERLSNDLGVQFRGTAGEIVAVYDTGKIAVQGKRQDEIKPLFSLVSTGPGPAGPSVPASQSNRSVFVVYGHDTGARNELEAMLRRWGLTPIILEQLTSGGQTLIEKLESARGQANFSVVLATPDDEGHRADHPDEKAHRARQNVVLEMGMMLSLLGRDRVAILMKDQITMERPSDIHGLLYIPFKDTVSEAALQLAKEISAKGMQIDLQKV